jgi:hypothetical protein
MDHLQEVIAIELQIRHNINFEEHRTLFGAIWRDIEARTVEDDGPPYLQRLRDPEALSDAWKDALDAAVRAIEEHELFSYFPSDPASQVEDTPQEQDEQENGSPLHEFLRWKDISLDWAGVHTARAEAFSKYVAKIVAVDADVMRFRERLLGDPLRTLSREEANDVVSCPAARFFDIGRFRKLCMPVDGRTITLESYETVKENERLMLRATISVNPPGITDTVFTLLPSQDSPLPNFTWPWDETKRTETFRVWQRSVLGELHKASVRLANEHPWSAEDAALFILTGETIFLSPIIFRTLRSEPSVDAHKYKHGEITLTVAPWVPGEVILEAYRKIRRSLGYSNRRPSGRHVALFRFVVSQSEVRIVKKGGLIGRWRARLSLPKWKELRSKWNGRYPAKHPWHYGQKDPHAKVFRRDFVRAQEAIIGTRYGLPGIPGRPMTQSEEQRWVQEQLGAAERADSQQ